jgi:hypothetical protein
LEYKRNVKDPRRDILNETFKPVRCYLNYIGAPCRNW